MLDAPLESNIMRRSYLDTCIYIILVYVNITPAWVHAYNAYMHGSPPPLIDQIRHFPSSSSSTQLIIILFFLNLLRLGRLAVSSVSQPNIDITFDPPSEHPASTNKHHHKHNS